MKKKCSVIALLLLIISIAVAMGLPLAGGGEPQRKKATVKGKTPRNSGTAKKRAKNKGAGVPKKVLDQYEVGKFQGIPYRFLAPEGYDASKKYPLILSLHGAGGTGDDNLSSMRNWTAIFVGEEWRKKYPCFVVAPQSPGSWRVTDEEVPEMTEERLQGFSEHWRKRFEERSDRLAELKESSKGSLTIAIELVEKISKEYSVDRDRVYVLGHSMGGFGSWNAVWARSDFFAAAIPSAGGLYPWKDPARFAKVPVWTFHGSGDKVVSVENTREIFEKLKKQGGNLKYTEMRGVGHNVVIQAFSYKGDEPDKGYVTRYAGPDCDKTEDVWDWLFKQKRKSK